MIKALSVLAAAGLCLSLAGCATLQDTLTGIGAIASVNIVNPVEDAQVTQIGNLLGTLNGAVVGYAGLPLCPRGHSLTPYDYCHDKALLKTLAGDMHVAVAAYHQLTDFQKAHPHGSTVIGGGFLSLIGQARAAVQTVQHLVGAYHIGGK